MSKSKVKNARFVYMDILRVIACVLVVLVHVSAIDWGMCDTTGLQWKVLNIINSLGMSGVPLFLMISGALFLREETDLNLRYVLKKMLLLLLFYISCLLFYNIVPFIRGSVGWEWESVRTNLIDNVLYGGGIYHLWFLPVLIMLYALSPVLKCGFASKKNCLYFLGLFAIFGLTIPLLLRYDLGLCVYLQSFQNRFGLFGLTDFLGYFVLGHYLHDFTEKLSKKKQIAAGCVACGTFLLMIVWNYFEGLGKMIPVSNVSTPMSITCFVFVSSLFLTVKNVMDVHVVKGTHIFRYLSTLTMGIYFIHPFVIENILKYMKLEIIFTNFAVLTIVRVIIVVVLSGIIAAILKKIPMLKKIF